MEMIKNARHIINDYKPPAGNPLDVTFRDPYTDFTRYFIGKRYLDLIEKSRPDPYDYTGMRSWQKIPRVHDRQFDIWYTRDIERREIGSAIEDGRKVYGKRFNDLLRHELLEGGLVAGKSLVVMALGTLNSFVIVTSG